MRYSEFARELGIVHAQADPARVSALRYAVERARVDANARELRAALKQAQDK